MGREGKGGEGVRGEGRQGEGEGGREGKGRRGSEGPGQKGRPKFSVVRKSISSLFLSRAVQEDFLLAAAISLPCPPQSSLPSMCASSSVSAGLCGSRFAARLACNSAQEQRPELGD